MIESNAWQGCLSCEWDEYMACSNGQITHQSTFAVDHIDCEVTHDEQLRPAMKNRRYSQQWSVAPLDDQSYRAPA